MEHERLYPRYDIKVVTRGDAAYAAFLIDHDTGDSWLGQEAEAESFCNRVPASRIQVC